MNIFEPWVLVRLFVGLTSVWFFLRAGATAVRVLRHFDVRRATEGQLAIERQMEIASAFLRAGAVVQVGALASSVLSADRLSHSIRGAMCGFGVFAENPWGFPSLWITAFVALTAGITAQLCAFDRGLRGMEMVRPIAIAALLMAPLSLVDLGSSAAFLLRLDLGALASCCSTQVDVGAASVAGYAAGSRVAASLGAVLSVSLCAWFALRSSARPKVSSTALAGALSLAALPLAIDAAMLEVAPHAYELPQHACPFCLLHADVLYLGYPLFGSMLLAAVWVTGAGAVGLVASKVGATEPFAVFARRRLHLGIGAWAVALALGAAPVVRHAVISGGKPLFP